MFSFFRSNHDLPCSSRTLSVFFESRIALIDPKRAVGCSLHFSIQRSTLPAKSVVSTTTTLVPASLVPFVSLDTYVTSPRALYQGQSCQVDRSKEQHGRGTTSYPLPPRPSPLFFFFFFLFTLQPFTDDCRLTSFLSLPSDAQSGQPFSPP